MASTESGSAVAANRATVEEIYAAFGRGDVPAILGHLADDCAWEAWEDGFAQRAGVPWLMPRTGPAGAGMFFAVVGGFEIHEFAVLDVVAGERQVAVEILIDATVPGGGRLRDEELHLWTFDDEGRVRRFRHFSDTAKHIAAAGGQDTTVV
jgi:ketosteroid isomerase-like protein